MAYSEKVIEHFEHSRNVGTLDKEDRTWAPGWLAHLLVAT
jgi:NifU-like protein involved in Fe-S cluster formation